MIAGCGKHKRWILAVITPEELSAVWKKHAPGLVLLARSRCPEVAEDLVQEAFARLAVQYQTPNDVLAWLARTIRNLAIDYIRGEVRRRDRENNAARTKRWFIESEWQEDDDDLEIALRKLDLLEQDIVIAKIWNGMTFRQIASLCDLSPSSVDRKYRNALEQLRRFLADSSETISEPKSSKSESTR